MSSKDTSARSAEGGLPERSRLETVGLVAGVVGATAIAFGIVLYALDPSVLTLGLLNVVAGVAGLLLYAITNRRTIGRRASLRSSGMFILEFITVVGVALGAITLNYLAATRNTEWDLTKDRLYTLHEQSIAVAKGLKNPVKFIGFFKPTDDDRLVVKGVLELYQQHTGAIELSFVNPDAAPSEIVNRYKLTPGSPRIVVVGPEDNWTKIEVPTEEAVTNALIRVATHGPKKVYFLLGHEEPSIEDTASPDGFGNLANSLRNDGYQTATMSLLDRENVPDDASVVVVGGAQSPFFKAEVDGLRAWLDRGGRMFFLLEPGIDLGLDQIWRRNGVRVNDDLVVEANPTAVSKEFGAEAPIVQSFEEHPITRPLKNTAAIFFRTRSVEPMLGLANLTVTTLVRTGPTSWGETRYREGGDQARDENDIPGPVPIALAITRKTAGNPRKFSDESRLVVFGDHHFASNRFSVVKGNVDLFLNSVRWLAGDDDSITIRPPRRGASRLPLTETESYGITFFSVNLLPLLIIAFGFSVWAIRRRK